MPEEEGEKDTNVGYLGIKRVCIDIFLLVYGTAINFHSSLGIFSVVCHYGLFAHMTKFRDEVLIEVSDDYSELSMQQHLGAFDAEEALWRPIKFLISLEAVVEKATGENSRRSIGHLYTCHD